MVVQLCCATGSFWREMGRFFAPSRSLICGCAWFGLRVKSAGERIILMRQIVFLTQCHPAAREFGGWEEAVKGVEVKGGSCIGLTCRTFPGDGFKPLA